MHVNWPWIPPAEGVDGPLASPRPYGEIDGIAREEYNPDDHFSS